MADWPAPRESRRYFPETGCTLEGAFLEFFEKFGLEFCGLPITDARPEAGVPTQYFERLVLEETTPNQVRPKAIGAIVLSARGAEQSAADRAAEDTAGKNILNPPPFPLRNLVPHLDRHPTQRYGSRRLDQVRHLIIHHSGVPASVDASTIASYHVAELGWPGIGYHFVVTGDGQILQTNALTTVANHARQYNSSGVGIVLLGNFAQSTPPAAQLDATATLCAWLRQALNLPLESIKGHRELVPVTCPGELWLQGTAWKFGLLSRVERLDAGLPLTPEPEPMALATPDTRMAAERHEPSTSSSAPASTAEPEPMALAAPDTEMPAERHEPSTNSPAPAPTVEPAPAPADSSTTELIWPPSVLRRYEESQAAESSAHEAAHNTPAQPADDAPPAAAARDLDARADEHAPRDQELTPPDRG